MINKQDFITLFKKTKTYNQLISDDNILLLFLGGSILWDVQDECSDIDFCVLVKTKKKQPRLAHLKYKNTEGHFYFDCISAFFDKGCFPGFRSYAAISSYVLKEENIIYKNEKYNNLFNYILNNEDIFKNAIYLSIDDWKDWFITKCYFNTFDDVPCRSKNIYHLLMYSYTLTNTPFDKELLISVKRNEDGVFTDTQKQKIIKCFLVLKDFYENFTPNTDELQKKINSLVEIE